MIPAIFLERTLLLPAQLTVYYFQHAHENPPLLFRDMNIINAIGIRNPLGAAVPQMIGSVFFNNDQENANANLWAHGQVELPFAGPLIATVVAAMLLRLLDGIVADKGTDEVRFLGVALCGSWAITWCNCAIQTSIITNGIAPAMLFLLIAAPGSAMAVKGARVPKRKSLVRPRLLVSEHKLVSTLDNGGMGGAASLPDDPGSAESSPHIA